MILIIFNQQVLWCMLSVLSLSVHGFSRTPASSRGVPHYSSAGRRAATTAAFLPLQKVQDKLDRDSTANDVLHFLHETGQFASYVGPQGTAIITGGTGGIGLPTLEAIARTGMKVILGTRDVTKARDELRNLSLRSSVSLDRVTIQQIDLADLNSVQTAIQNIIESEKKIDVIINCAAINSLPERTVTPQNFEQQMTVNHIGPFFLTNGILPHMNQSGRVVVVSSMSHHKARSLNADDLNSEKCRYSPFGVYCKSKLANILFATTLQEKLHQSGSEIKAVSLHPGRVATNLWRHVDGNLINSLGDYVFARAPEQGAATVVYASLVTPARLEGGDYLVDCAQSSPSLIARENEGFIGEKLWISTESLIRDANFQFPETSKTLFGTHI